MPLLYSEHTSGLEMFAANSTITVLQEIRLTCSLSFGFGTSPVLCLTILYT